MKKLSVLFFITLFLVSCGNGDYYNEQGTSLYYSGKYEEAIEMFDKAIEKEPNDGEYYYGKGYSLINLGKYEEAIKVLDKAIELNPNDGEYYYEKGYSLNALGKYEEALKVVEDGLKILTNKYFKKYIENLKNLSEKIENFKKNSKSLDFSYLIESSSVYSSKLGKNIFKLESEKYYKENRKKIGKIKFMIRL